MYALRRLGQGLLSLLVVSIAIWSLMAFTPGDPALRILQARGILEPTAEQVELLRAELGLDRPLILRYLDWLTGLARGGPGPRGGAQQPEAASEGVPPFQRHPNDTHDRSKRPQRP